MFPVALDLTGLAAHLPNRQALAKVFSELEFHSLMTRWTGSIPVPSRREKRRPLSAATERCRSEPNLRCRRYRCGLSTIPPNLRPSRAHWPRHRWWHSIARLHRCSHTTPELIGLSLAMSSTEVWYLSFGHREPSGNLFEAPQGGAPARPGAKSPADHVGALRANPGSPGGSRRTEGGTQSQVRRASVAASRGRSRRDHLRFDDRFIRARSVAPLARHRRPRARIPRSDDDAVHRSHRQRKDADSVRGRCRWTRRRHTVAPTVLLCLRSRPTLPPSSSATPCYRCSSRLRCHSSRVDRHGMGGNCY